MTKAGKMETLSAAGSAYLDLLRALGANLVIVSHVLALYFGIKHKYPFGSLGVAIFFLLSGFLIMQSLLNRSQRPGPHLPAFLADRAARILTPYVPALILIVIVNVVLIERHYGGNGANEGVLAFLGNLLLLQDHSGFQLLELVGYDLSWRIRPYMTAEPFWTVAIEMWIYVAMGLFFYCLLHAERIRTRYLVLLAAVSLPTVAWNAAAGGGQSLTLIWLLGAIGGLLFHLWRARGYARANLLGSTVVAFAVVALAGRCAKVGFNPYELQTATLMALLMFGVLALLVPLLHCPIWLRRSLSGVASYSYSLYLLHNTILIVVLESVPIANVALRATVGVVLAHVCSYGLYIAFERHYRTVGAWLRPAFHRVLTTPSVQPEGRVPELGLRKPRSLVTEGATHADPQ